jgi:hypothetical protein
MTLEGGGKGGGGAPAADPNIGIAQREMSALAKEQWNKFTTDIYPEMLKQSQSQEKRAQDQYDLTSSITKQQQEYAAADRRRYEEGGIPAMEKLKADADLYNTQAEQERLAQGARADVTSAMDNQRQQQMMRQQAYGIDPTSGATQFASNAMGANQALMEAQAANQTRQAAKDIGLQKQANVYNMYAGLPAQANASTGIALGSSAQGIQGGQTAISNYGATGAALNAGAGTAMSGWNNVGNLGVGATNAATNAYAANQQAGGMMASGLGSAIGSGVALYAKTGGSDVSIKQDVKRIGTLLNDIPLYSYNYKPEYRDTWGHGPQVGVMAHEVEHIPGAVSLHADGYKVVDYSKVMHHGI